MENKVIMVQAINNLLWDGKVPMKDRSCIYQVRFDPNSGLPITGISKEEEKWLEEEKDTPVGHFGPKSMFWNGDKETDCYTIHINESLTKLELSNPDDFIKYKILKTLPSVTDKPEERSRRNFHFFMYSPEDVQKANEKIFSARKEALRLLFGMTDDERKEAYTLLGLKTSGVTDMQIEKGLYDFIDTRSIVEARRFMDTITDKLRHEKLLVHSLLNKGILFRSAGQICHISAENQLGTSVTDVARMIAQPKNNKLKIELLKANDDSTDTYTTEK